MSFPISRPFSNAAFLFSYTPETYPTCSASCALQSLAVNATSFTKDIETPDFGNRLSVPTSAANPTSTSRTENRVSLEQIRISQQHVISMARPYDIPCMTAIVG